MLNSRAMEKNEKKDKIKNLTYNNSNKSNIKTNECNNKEKIFENITSSYDVIKDELNNMKRDVNKKSTELN